MHGYYNKIVTSRDSQSSPQYPNCLTNEQIAHVIHKEVHSIPPRNDIQTCCSHLHTWRHFDKDLAHSRRLPKRQIDLKEVNDGEQCQSINEIIKCFRWLTNKAVT